MISGETRRRLNVRRLAAAVARIGRYFVRIGLDGVERRPKLLDLVRTATPRYPRSLKLVHSHPDRPPLSPSDLVPVATDDALTANRRFWGIADMKQFLAPDGL
jgi:hypothetical protein